MPEGHAVRSSWTRIVRWLEAHAPASAQALNAPATAADLRELRDGLGYDIPGDLEAWLRLNNGSTAKDSSTPVPGGTRPAPHPDSALFPGGEVFLDCRSITTLYRNNIRIADEIGDTDWWAPSWIPIVAQPDSHHGLVLDTGQGRGADPVLAYHETDYPKPHAASLEEVLTGVADMLEHGDGDGLLTRGYEATVQDGRVVWQ